MTLERIRNITDKGYIDDPELVAQITDRFLSLPVTEITGAAGGDLAGMMDALLPVYDADEELLSELTYGEAVCLIANIARSPAVSISDITPAEFRRFQIAFLKRILLEAALNDPAVDQFLSLNIGALFRYFSERHHDSRIEALYNGFLAQCGDRFPDLKEKLTEERISVRAVLEEIRTAQGRSWCPWKNLKEYGLLQIKTTILEAKLLIDSFYLAYREKMCHQSLLVKIGAGEGGYEEPDHELTEEEENERR